MCLGWLHFLTPLDRRCGYSIRDVRDATHMDNAPLRRGDRQVLQPHTVMAFLDLRNPC